MPAVAAAEAAGVEWTVRRPALRGPANCPGFPLGRERFAARPIRTVPALRPFGRHPLRRARRWQGSYSPRPEAAASESNRSIESAIAITITETVAAIRRTATEATNPGRSERGRLNLAFVATGTVVVAQSKHCKISRWKGEGRIGGVSERERNRSACYQGSRRALSQPRRTANAIGW